MDVRPAGISIDAYECVNVQIYGQLSQVLRGIHFIEHFN